MDRNRDYGPQKTRGLPKQELGHAQTHPNSCLDLTMLDHIEVDIAKDMYGVVPLLACSASGFSGQRGTACRRFGRILVYVWWLDAAVSVEVVNRIKCDWYIVQIVEIDDEIPSVGSNKLANLPGVHCVEKVALVPWRPCLQ